ncbi:PilZ domain-containing protein [Bacillus sp. FJAT-27445]|uniref:PilZ domain-containing protein n=1 Tax=Bacillus sp. FJAT-27445 TaxID=1679166 RepID=UPI0007442324|nr:PilZ domain-containing protein [Bacillus sp. FJAT-27445]
MQDQQLIILGALVVLFLIAAIFLFLKNRKNHSQKQTMNEEKADNKRENFRIHVEIEESVMEVKKIGSEEMDKPYTCKVTDVSAGGAGVLCEEDFTLRDKIFVTLHFSMNKEQFTFNGRIVRKIENLGRKQSLYGIQFLDMPVADENKLIKEIIAIENNRRKISIK